MKQSLFGVAIIIIGYLGLRFSEPLARTSKAINDRIGGLTLPVNWGSRINQISGLLLIVSGLLLALHLIPAPWK